MGLVAVAGILGRTLAVVPRAGGKIQMPDRPNRLAGLRRNRFVLGVPKHHARMVPTLAQPLRILLDQLRCEWKRH